MDPRTHGKPPDRASSYLSFLLNTGVIPHDDCWNAANMLVLWFVAVKTVGEETVRSRNTTNGWHRVLLPMVHLTVIIQQVM